MFSGKWSWERCFPQIPLIWKCCRIFLTTTVRNFILSDPPIYQLRIEPVGPVSEEKHLNVTLHWYAVEGVSLNHIPMKGNIEMFFFLPCVIQGFMVFEWWSYKIASRSSVPFESEGMILEELLVNVFIDPTEVMVQDFRREMQGNFTWVGSNIAGEESISEPEELTVFCEYSCKTVRTII